MDDMAKADGLDDQPAAHEHRLGFMIYRAGLAIARGYERILKPIGVTPVETGVLGSLSYQGPNHVRGLARQLGVGRQTIVNVARSLEANGWISRSASPDDARMVVFSISQSGRTKMHEIDSVAVLFDAQLGETIGTSNERYLIDSMRHIVEAPFLRYED